MFGKLFSGAAALVFAVSAFTGCTNDKSAEPTASAGSGSASDSSKIRVVCTVFPQYDWSKHIIGEHSGSTELTLLRDSGADLHNYQPTASDIVKLSTCDIFIYVGGESDEWVDDALAQATNKNMKVINMLEVLGSAVKEEEVREGMEPEEEEDEEEEGSEYDEHVWLSLKNAVTICDAISEALGSADSGNAANYTANCAAYTAELEDLDAQYSEAISSAKVRTVLFGDRFPFRYLTDDYGLDYYAAFVGCSAETEASFETIAFLAGKADELGLKTVFVIDGSDGKIARSVIDSTAAKDADIAELDSMQSVTAARISEGTDYISIMKNNLEVLKKELNK